MIDLNAYAREEYGPAADWYIEHSFGCQYKKPGDDCVPGCELVVEPDALDEGGDRLD